VRHPDDLGRRAVRRPRPTMVDVAREAGVALRTVSRVVNGDPTVGEAFAQRVRHAIAMLDYQPDERARQLRSGVTGTVGAAVRNIFDAHPVLGAAYEAARAAGLMVVAMSTEDDEEREREAVMSMCGRRMDGIIIEPIAENHEYLQPEIDSGLPVVAFDRPATGVSVDTVLTDNRGGIELAFKHLARHGHQRPRTAARTRAPRRSGPASRRCERRRRAHARSAWWPGSAPAPRGTALRMAGACSPHPHRA
jgi:LacI family transcriptional regulator